MHRVVIGALVAAAIGCSGPVGPDPVPPPDPGPITSNTPPVVTSIRVQGTRVNQPAGMADVLEDVAVTATVIDAETPVTGLKFIWTANAGTFIGTGPIVTWRAPAQAVAPTTVRIDLAVVEPYTSQGRAAENRVTAFATVALHDSIREVGDLSRQFLLDFSDSRLSVEHVMRNFQPGCYGTPLEIGDVTRNREDFTIQESSVGAATTTVAFGGTCPFRGRKGDACARVPVFWRSEAKRDLYNSAGQLILKKGESTTAQGVDQVAAVYDRDQKLWKLCDSAFDSGATSLAEPLRGLVP
ncbi:MAG TPA: hypothetical protein VJM31_15570 [Vicinamibacterales bacterium]|nr:hypothetical protein [Vicinamibacterales bacterium]